MEIDILKKYFANKENFGQTSSSQDNVSPSKTLLGSPSKKKNVYDLMEQRIEKLKHY